MVGDLSPRQMQAHASSRLSPTHAGLREKAPMFDRDLDLPRPAGGRGPSRPCPASRLSLAAFLAASPACQAFLRPAGFTAAAAEIRLLPGGDGVAGAVFGLGDGTDPHLFGALPFGLPPVCWRIEPGDFPTEDATLGFCLGAYQFTLFKPARPCATLVGQRAGRRRTGGPRHLAGARPDQHPGGPPRPGRAGRGGGRPRPIVRRHHQHTVSGEALQRELPRGRGRGRRIGPRAGRGDIPLAGQRGGGRIRR